LCSDHGQSLCVLDTTFSLKTTRRNLEQDCRLRDRYTVAHQSCPSLRCYHLFFVRALRAMLQSAATEQQYADVNDSLGISHGQSIAESPESHSVSKKLAWVLSNYTRFPGHHRPPVPRVITNNNCIRLFTPLSQKVHARADGKSCADTNRRSRGATKRLRTTSTNQGFEALQSVD
jgi:hypothetical protein